MCSLLPHLVFSLGASLLDPHWLVSLWVCLSSPGWSSGDRGDHVRSEVLERVRHLTEKSSLIFFIHSFSLCFFFSFHSFPPYSQQIWYPGGRSRMFAREILPLSPSSNSTITLPSFSSSPGPPKAQHTGTEDMSFWECMCADRVRLSVRLAHLGGRIRGKDSESARSSRHTLASLQSGWLRSGAARLTPGEKITKILCIIHVKFHSSYSQKCKV